MLDFRVQTFLTVCRTLNYTQAARELNITQPAVSQHIAALERHYGAPLFVKEGKRPRLTEAGKLLQQVCITMVRMGAPGARAPDGARAGVGYAGGTRERPGST